MALPRFRPHRTTTGRDLNLVLDALQIALQNYLPDSPEAPHQPALPPPPSGVNSITAGPGIVISPASGQGVVTVSRSSISTDSSADSGRVHAMWDDIFVHPSAGEVTVFLSGRFNPFPNPNPRWNVGAGGGTWYTPLYSGYYMVSTGVTIQRLSGVGNGTIDVTLEVYSQEILGPSGIHERVMRAFTLGATNDAVQVSGSTTITVTTRDINGNLTTYPPTVPQFPSISVAVKLVLHGVSGDTIRFGQLGYVDILRLS